MIKTIFKLFKGKKMSVTVQLMSKDRYSFSIFEGYRIRNLRHEVAETLRIRDSERIIFHNNDYEQVDDFDLIEDDSFFYVFISEPPTIKIAYENEKILLYFDEKLMDTESYQHCITRGIKYEGISAPDRPFILQVDKSVGNKAYRHITRIFYNQWIDDNREEFEDILYGVYGVPKTFEHYYLSKISNYIKRRCLTIIEDNIDEDNEDEEDEEAINNLLSKTNHHDHLYVYLSQYLPRKRNIYD